MIDFDVIKGKSKGGIMKSILSIRLNTCSVTYAGIAALQVLGASFLLALASQVAFFLPFTPVFVSLQTATLFLIGMTLGPVKGVAAVLLYLMEGMMGLPVFALGQSGIGVILGPQGGYLVGFILAVFISGFYSKKSLNFLSYCTIFLFSNAAIFACGLPWLSLFVGMDQVLELGLYPFLLGDLLKIGASAALMRGIITCK
jgi:biotin transport system substrate-specific component